MTGSHLLDITAELVRKLIFQQFPEYADFPLSEVECQGHDNRTYRLGKRLLIRMPSAPPYALKVPIEQELLPNLAKYLTLSIPAPIKMGAPSTDYPYPFSIYKWLPGKSINLLTLSYQQKEQLAYDLAQFLKELQGINYLEGRSPGSAKALVGLEPGQHNGWRGAHISVYDKEIRQQLSVLSEIVDQSQAIELWNRACRTYWCKAPVWIHGDLAIGNILMENGRLSALIDFGCTAVGDPACDLVIAWTYFSGKSRQLFIQAMPLDEDTWLRARAWALWKATFELCQVEDKKSPKALIQRRIIEAVLY